MAEVGAYPPTEIASARDGAGATLRGRIRAALATALVSPLGEQECVYWEINDSVGGDEPERFEVVDFWLEDATGRALVRGERLEVRARAEQREQTISVIDASIRDVSDRISWIKRQRRFAAGAEASKLNAEHRRLKKLATLLCAIGAHARGNVHVGGTRARQEVYIRERSARFASEAQGQRAISLMGEKFECVLQEGDEIEVSGLCVIEAVPPSLGHGGGYRDAPTCLHVRAPAGRPLHVRGVGASAPVVRSQHALQKRNRPGPLARPGLAERVVALGPWPWILLAGGALLYVLLG